MARVNPFQKAERGKKWVKLLISGGSGGGKTLTALQIACHMAVALGRPGSVGVIDTEDGSADLYSFDSVVGEPFLCSCEQCLKGGDRMPLEFDHLDLRDHSPQEIQKAMRALIDNRYAVGVLDSASHEWCGVNGCLEQVDALKGDGKGRKTDNAWNHITALHNAFLSDIRAIPIHLIATARTKPSREEGAEDIIVQRDKDGPFYYEFGFWGRVSRQAAGTLHIAKSRSGHFQGEVWKRAGKFAAEQFMLWGGHIRLPGAVPTSNPVVAAAPHQPAPEPTSEARAPAPEEPRRRPESCKHTNWSPGQWRALPGDRGISGTFCDDCNKFQPDEEPPADPTPSVAASPAAAEVASRLTLSTGSPASTPDAKSVDPVTPEDSPSVKTEHSNEPTTEQPTSTLSEPATPGPQQEAAAPSAPGGGNGASGTPDIGELVKLIGIERAKLHGKFGHAADHFLQQAGADLEKVSKLLKWTKDHVASQPSYRDQMRVDVVKRGLLSGGEAQETQIVELERMLKTRPKAEEPVRTGP